MKFWKRGERRNEKYKSRLLNGVIEPSIVDRKSLIIDVGSKKNRKGYQIYECLREKSKSKVKNVNRKRHGEQKVDDEQKLSVG